MHLAIKLVLEIHIYHKYPYLIVPKTTTSTNRSTRTEIPAAKPETFTHKLQLKVQVFNYSAHIVDVT